MVFQEVSRREQKARKSEEINQKSDLMGTLFTIISAILLITTCWILLCHFKHKKFRKNIRPGIICKVYREEHKEYVQVIRFISNDKVELQNEFNDTFEVCIYQLYPSLRLTKYEE